MSELERKLPALGFALHPRPAIVVVYAHPTDASKLRKRVVPVRDHAVLRLEPSVLAEKLRQAVAPLLDEANEAWLLSAAVRLASEMRKATNKPARLPGLAGVDGIAKPAKSPVYVSGSHDGAKSVAAAHAKSAGGLPSGSLRAAGTVGASGAGSSALAGRWGGGAATLLPSGAAVAKPAPRLGSAGGLDLGDALDSLDALKPAPKKPSPWAVPDTLDALDSLSIRPTPAVAKPTAAQLLRSDLFGSVDSFDSPLAGKQASAVKPKPKPKSDPLAALLGMSSDDSDDGAAGKYGLAAARAGGGRSGGGWKP
ncbi:hypothetical protein T492DRAFT_940301 [Pavlovales sp. CCMP2436]|nr:hypothetical protein T492DRAFT_940301 [Pavlovales sp. CCMP2436]